MTESYYLPFGPDVKLEKPFGVKPVDEWRAPAGEPIRAAGDGVVVFAGSAEDRFYVDNFTKNHDYHGDVVVLKMSGAVGPFFEYRNPSEIEVNANDRVEAGQIIALAGEESCQVGALPWRFNLSSRTAGRVNPRLYQTEYWAETVNGEPEKAPVIPTAFEEPAAPKRKRGSRAAEPVAVEPVAAAPVAEVTPTPSEPVEVFPISGVAPETPPVDAGITTETQ